MFDGITFLVSVLTVSRLRILQQVKRTSVSLRQDWSEGYALIKNAPLLRRLLSVDVVWLLVGTAPILVIQSRALIGFRAAIAAVTDRITQVATLPDARAVLRVDRRRDMCEFDDR